VKVTEGTIAAQIFVMFAAGFETTSQANTYMMYELARQPELMRKVQEECDCLLKETGGVITYEMLPKMEYTDMVIKGTHTRVNRQNLSNIDLKSKQR